MDKKILSLIAITVLVCSISFVNAVTIDYNFGNGSDGNLIFTTSTKSYGNLSSPSDYNVSDNTLYLNLNRKYQFYNFVIGSGTTVTTTNSTGAVLYIMAQNDLNVSGSIVLNNILNNGTISSTFDGINAPSVASGGNGGMAIIRGTFETIYGGSGGNNGYGFGGGGGGGDAGDNGGSAYGNGADGRDGCSPIGSVGSIASIISSPEGFSGASPSASIGCSVGGNGAVQTAGNPETTVYGGVSSNSYGGNASIGSASGTYCPNNCFYAVGGAGGTGGLAGKSGVNLMLYGKKVLFNGSCNLSGTNGGSGGNGSNGLKQTDFGSVAVGGGGGGGGGGGNSGSLYIYYYNLISNTGTKTLSKGTGGAGGTGGVGIIVESMFNVNRSSDNGSSGTDGSDGSEILLNLESIPPNTSISVYQTPYLGESRITFVCTDNFGCKKVYYKINNVGEFKTLTYDVDTNYFDYDVSGVHNIAYYSEDNSGNFEDIKYFDFNTYGSLQFRTFDQNAIADIDGVTINVDGTDYNAIANSWFAYDLEGITTNTTKTFTFSKTGYANAIYQIDVNEFYDQPEDYFDISLAPTSLSSAVPFKFYKPDGVTLYSNVYAELINTSLDRRIGRIKTNSLGEASFNMIKTDNNYNQILNNGEVTYNPVALTILYPKDEQSQTDITGNWKARTSINYVYSDNNIPDSTSKTIYLQPNTKYAHKISIQDIAENYFERTWDLLYTGNPLTDILQPYLIDADDGTAVTFVFQNPKRDSIENVIVNIYDNILGERTLVTSGSSDITGNALFFLIANKTYELEFIYNGVTILSTTNYTVTTNKVYWTIDLTGQEIKKIDQSYFNIRWTPFVDYISSDTLNLGYVATGKNINYTSVNFYTLNTDGTKTITHTYQKNCTTPCTVSVPLTDVNISSGNIYADANIYSDSNTIYFTYTKRWSAGTEKSINTQNLFINARRSFGCSIDTAIPCPLTNITAVVIMILVLGGIVFKFNFSNPKGLLVIGLGILGVFTYLGWFWWIPLVLMIIGSIFYLRGDN